MTPDEFRQYGRQVVDWLADYWTEIERHPVLSQVSPGDVSAQLPTTAPEQGESFGAMLRDLESVVLPGITHWQHPSFFAYFPANTSGPSVLADLACAGLGVQGMLWTTSPACTELETVTLDWLAELLQLPPQFRSTGDGGGVIQDTASSSVLVATLAALHRASDGAVTPHGIDQRYAVYTSTQAHSAVEKAARIAGIGADSIRLVDVEPETLAARPGRLRELIVADIADGVVPALVVATVGTTSTTAVDPVEEIGLICHEYGVWLHIDAAYAGVAAVCPEFHWLSAGLELADSYATNPHKWLLTGFDCDAFYVADRARLVETLSVLPEFLRNAATESGAVVDYRDWQIPLGRRFRALKLWFVLRWYGAEGLRAHIRSGVALAQEFASWVAADSRFEVMAPHPLSLVCFRMRARDGRDDAGADEDNLRLLERLNASGALYLTHTKVRGRLTLRLAVGAPMTQRRHVAAAWERIQAEAATIG